MDQRCRMPEIDIPEELPDFNAPGSVGTWRQILAANIGRCVKLEIAVQIEGPMRVVCGEIFTVGSSYVGLINNGKVILSDILGLKFVYFE